MVENNLRRPLADRRANGGAFADKIGAVRVWLQNRIRDDGAAALGTGAEMLNLSKSCLLRVAIVAAAVAATNEEKRDSSQHK